MQRNGSMKRMGLVLLGLALLAPACTNGGGAVTTTTEPSVTVEANLALTPLTVDVRLTDTGFEPPVIFIPAGRQIYLVLRDGGALEHHFRIAGLVPAKLAWIQIPEISAYDIDSLSPEQLLDYGIDLEEIKGDDALLEHYLHHITNTWVPTREPSPSGIRPLGTEVHGYVTPGEVDVISFIALTTGRYTSEDVLWPDLTGTVVVFQPPADGAAG